MHTCVLNAVGPIVHICDIQAQDQLAEMSAVLSAHGAEKVRAGISYIHI